MAWEFLFDNLEKPILMFKMNNVIGLTTVTSPSDNVWGKQQQSQFK